MNLQEVLDSLDIFRKVTGIRLEDIYNQRWRKAGLWGSRSIAPNARNNQALSPAQVKLLTEVWKPGTRHGGVAGAEF